jgi:hypothetical protein
MISVFVSLVVIDTNKNTANVISTRNKSATTKFQTPRAFARHADIRLVKGEACSAYHHVYNIPRTVCPATGEEGRAAFGDTFLTCGFPFILTPLNETEAFLPKCAHVWNGR